MSKIDGRDYTGFANITRKETYYKERFYTNIVQTVTYQLRAGRSKKGKILGEFSVTRQNPNMPIEHESPRAKCADLAEHLNRLVVN